MSKRSILPWLRLTRLPAVFTALADICVGFLLTRTEWEPRRDFLGLLGASAGLYLAGMVFNDVFDVQQDRRERPQRPIPSGDVSWRGAVALGTVLMGIGLALAASVSLPSMLVASLLAIAILSYDGWAKRTPLGPLVMGSCRMLNVLLGASSGVHSFAEIWSGAPLWMALAMGTYITGVTWFARSEARSSRRQTLIPALLVIDLGLGLLLLWILQIPARWGLDLGPAAGAAGNSVLLLWAVIFASINRRCLKAIADPVPAQVQPAIGSMLLSIISINAMMIFFRLGPAGLVMTLATLALLLPAVLLKRTISMT